MQPSQIKRETHHRATEHHLPSHSVICHPRRVNAPRLNHIQKFSVTIIMHCSIQPGFLLTYPNV